MVVHERGRAGPGLRGAGLRGRGRRVHVRPRGVPERRGDLRARTAPRRPARRAGARPPPARIDGYVVDIQLDLASPGTSESAFVGSYPIVASQTPGTPAHNGTARRGRRRGRWGRRARGQGHVRTITVSAAGSTMSGSFNVDRAPMAGAAPCRDRSTSRCARSTRRPCRGAAAVAHSGVRFVAIAETAHHSRTVPAYGGRSWLSSPSRRTGSPATSTRQARSCSSRSSSPGSCSATESRRTRTTTTRSHRRGRTRAVPRSGARPPRAVRARRAGVLRAPGPEDGAAARGAARSTWQGAQARARRRSNAARGAGGGTQLARAGTHVGRLGGLPRPVRPHDGALGLRRPEGQGGHPRALRPGAPVPRRARRRRAEAAGPRVELRRCPRGRAAGPVARRGDRLRGRPGLESAGATARSGRSGPRASAHGGPGTTWRGGRSMPTARRGCRSHFAGPWSSARATPRRA